jgi:predicted NodU family carbamoyl transferase
MNILGISSFYHDAAACLMSDGRVVAAASEERFTRKKHDQSFPRHAIEYCLTEGRILVDDLDFIGFYEKPFIKFKRILSSHIATFPRSYPAFLRAIPSWLRQKLSMAACEPTILRIPTSSVLSVVDLCRSGLRLPASSLVVLVMAYHLRNAVRAL